MDTIRVGFYRRVHMTGMPMCAMLGEKTVVVFFPNFQNRWINRRVFLMFFFNLFLFIIYVKHC